MLVPRSYLHQYTQAIRSPSLWRRVEFTASHDQTIKLAAYERAGVPEVWLIHPTERTLTIYRLEAGCYGRATVRELKGQTPITSVSGVTIDWD